MTVNETPAVEQTETGAVLGLSREEFGYDVPVIDQTVIVRPGQFSLEPTAIAGNFFWAILFAVVMGISSVMLKHLIALDEERVRRVLRRLPFQAVFTLFVIWLMHILVPDTFAQGTTAAATSSVLKIPVYALLFFLVVGTSNYIFNNLVGANIEKSGTRLWNETLPDRVWFIVILTLAYGVVGAHINPQFNLFPGQQLGIILIAVATIIFSLCFKDMVMYGLTKKRKMSGRFRANVGGFAIAVMCVVLDRSFALNPGYIYGVPLGLLITSQLFEEREGFFEFLSIVWVFAFTVIVWIIGAFLSPYPALFDFMNLLFVLLVEDAFFELLPLPYLTGGAIFSWKKLAWFAEFVVVTFFLFHTLFNPQGTVYNIAQSPPTLSAIVLLGCYAVGVLLLWAYVRWGQGKRSA